MVVGVDSDFTVGVSGSDVSLSNATSDGDILIKVNDGGVVSTAMTVDGATNRVLVAGAPSDNLGVATKAYVDSSVSSSGALPTTGGTMTGNILISGTVDIGTSGNRVSTVFATTFNGTSTAAQYADLAENFRADSAYAPGTIVALGGAEEITAVNDELSNNVFGVVSSKPAYLMNSAQEGGSPVAVAGRVPVRVIGMVNKGDRLVSAGNGLARAVNSDESITAFNVIGRAISSKTTMEEGTVEAFVTIN
jgi:hypothetical protein